MKLKTYCRDAKGKLVTLELTGDSIQECLNYAKQVDLARVSRNQGRSLKTPLLVVIEGMKEAIRTLK